MRKKWTTNPKVHILDDVGFAESATARRQKLGYASGDGGRDKMFPSDPVQVGDPENLSGQKFAANLADWGEGLDYNVRMMPAKFTGDIGVHKGTETQHKLGTKREGYGRGVADDSRLKGKR